MSNLLERLNLEQTDRSVILSLDDLGMFNATNEAIYRALRSGRATAASLMVPAPWARRAAFDYRGEDIGVHLTLNSELDLYRWAPITAVPSLLDGDGAFPRTVHDVWEHADLDEVRREWRAQIERAVQWGIGVTHLDTHLGGVEMRPEFFDIYLDLAHEFALPIRLPGKDEERRVGFPFRQLARDRGVLAPDRAYSLATLGSNTIEVVEALKGLPPGVTEIYARPATDSGEIRAGVLDFEERIANFDLIEGDEHLAGALARAGIVEVGYRALRALMT